VSALFAAGPFRAVEVTAADVPELQRFFEANPEYHLAVTGEAPALHEGQKEFELAPPAGWPFEKRWLLAFVAKDGTWIGVGDVISNLFVPGVWHVGLFMVATSLRGSGAARSLYYALESWMRGSGARWLRLGVVEGNARAERFWESAGYTEVRKRNDVQMGKQFNTLRVMVKPLGAEPLAQYLAAIARDRPE
jgi:GNAT superfamily N-acetyltransferase